MDMELDPIIQRPEASQESRPPTILQLWWLGVSRPNRAFDAIRAKPAPAWGFWILVGFNLAISLTTDLARWLLGDPLLLDSWLTFLPAEDYLFAELFFLPVLRVLTALLGAGVIHVFLRLVNQPSDYDTQVNIGGMTYLIVMPVILVSDWILLAVGHYELSIYTHPLSMFWSVPIGIIGVRCLLNARTPYAVAGVLLTELVSIPLLAIFAR